MTVQDFDKAVEYALQLSPEEKVRLLARVANELNKELTQLPMQDDEPWTDEEIAEMLKPTPMTGAEIVESPEIGSWADLGIEDSVEWLEQRKQARRNKFNW